jgi:hypothetical protein
MSKKVELFNAEINATRKGDAFNEFKTEKGGSVFNFSTKTKVNDKVDRCPVIFDSCSVFAETDEAKQSLRKTLAIGAIVNIKGFAERRKGDKDGPDGKPQYFDSINVKEILPVTSTQMRQPPADADDNLPF